MNNKDSMDKEQLLHNAYDKLTIAGKNVRNRQAMKELEIAVNALYGLDKHGNSLQKNTPTHNPHSKQPLKLTPENLLNLTDAQKVDILERSMKRDLTLLSSKRISPPVEIPKSVVPQKSVQKLDLNKNQYQELFQAVRDALPIVTGQVEPSNKTTIEEQETEKMLSVSEDNGKEYDLFWESATIIDLDN